MMQFIFFLEAAQDRDGVLDRRFADEYGLEPPLERGVFLDIFAIFVERSRADAVQLTAREGGLQEIARVHRAFGFSRADQLVHFVDEEDDMALGGLHFVQHAL